MSVDYSLLCRQLEALFESETNLIANLANTSALLFSELPELNWVGFYVRDDGPGNLVLGPFQGQPACVRIPWGEGVCGSAAARRETIRVDDVHAFPGHIACDSQSRSEIVVPLIVDDSVFGVMDLDSPVRSRFTRADQDGLEAVARAVQFVIPRGL